MDTFWWRAAWGFCLVQLSLAQIDLNITCRYAGVFHVEKNGRYSISRTEAADLCKAFNSTLPTMAQMKHALSIGFETCRYGFIEGHVVIPRITPNAICAANNTGVYIVTSNTSQYDTYCYNASAAPDAEDCTSVTDLPNAFEGPITITIVNRDGTRYTQKGEYRTNPEDIHPSNPTDDDVSSGSSSETSTSGGYIFHTLLPTMYPNPDQRDPWVSASSDSTPSTKQSHSQSFSTAHGGLEEDKDHPTATTPTSSNRIDGRGGGRGGNLSEDSTTSGEGYVLHSPDTKENRTLIPVTPAKTGSPGVPEVNVVGDSNFNVDRSLSGDQDSFVDPDGRSHTTHGSKSGGHSSGSQEGEANTTSGPVRKPQIPEWLIILASLLALALILAVCIAVNSRRRCGQKKKLVINNGNGAVEDRKPSGLNGEASKSQEMVHLVNKESSETPDQFMTADETRNLQNVDMKIGV
ncbi:CD44 antigen isoform X16 [Choloepus didactylus]|uniref:CD44 antigen isoform X16 n=1 Tax=Choloepus didactylus TaxID=27675 RepID=UPI00189ED44C|nr:CD44 antigen isoform X16 [Choloepus didactylus]